MHFHILINSLCKLSLSQTLTVELDKFSSMISVVPYDKMMLIPNPIA